MAVIRVKALMKLAAVIATFGPAVGNGQRTGVELAKYVQACICIHTGR